MPISGLEVTLTSNKRIEQKAQRTMKLIKLGEASFNFFW